jgi:hypothetical protein
MGNPPDALLEAGLVPSSASVQRAKESRMSTEGLSATGFIRRRGAWLGLAAVAAVVISALAVSTAGRSQAAVEAGSSAAAAGSVSLDTQLALARAATAKYVSDLGRAKADGYRIITRMIPDMGYHYMNASVKGFDIEKPPILVYEHRGASWQLGALEWVFTSKPASAPLPGAHYGTFGAGCHYADGTFVPADAQAGCPTTAPTTGAKFTFWHPLLFTMHVWLWYPNPNGLYASTNPRVAPFNHG